MKPLVEVTYPGMVTSSMIGYLLNTDSVRLAVCGYSGELRIIWDSDKLTIEGGSHQCSLPFASEQSELQ